MNAELKKQLEEMRFTGEAGDGIVSVAINGNLKVLALDLQDECIEEEEIYIIEEMITVAVNDALEKALAARDALLGVK